MQDLVGVGGWTGEELQAIADNTNSQQFSSIVDMIQYIIQPNLLGQA